MTQERQPILATTIPTPSLVMTVGERQNDHRITVASLCCDSGQAKSVSAESVMKRHLHISALRCSSDVVTNTAQDGHTGHSDATVDLNLSPLVQSGGLSDSGLATQLRRMSRSNTENVCTTIPYHPPNSSKAVYKHHSAEASIQSMDQPTSIQSSPRSPRPSRLPYTEEQKFFIMYHRVIKELSWPEIKDKYARLFTSRSEDGLTSVYYRIRDVWRMDQKNNSDSVSDRSIVEAKAEHFSEGFLESFGYFDQTDV